MVAGGAIRRAAVVGVDIMSTIINLEDRATSVLFGDGAGAVIVERVEDGLGILDFEHKVDGSGGKFLYMPAGGSLKPATAETVAAKEHYIHQAGSEVFKNAVREMADNSKLLMDANGFKGDELKLFVPHQANIRIMDAAARRLELDPSRMMVNIDRYANTTTATIPPPCIRPWVKIACRKVIWWPWQPSAPASPGGRPSSAGLLSHDPDAVLDHAGGRRIPEGAPTLSPPVGDLRVRPTSDRAGRLCFRSSNDGPPAHFSMSARGLELWVSRPIHGGTRQWPVSNRENRAGPAFSEILPACPSNRSAWICGGSSRRLPGPGGDFPEFSPGPL